MSLLSTRSRPTCLWDCALCFEVLFYFIHLPILQPTTYCLAAGVAGGWHFLLEYIWCGRDLWTRKRPVGVRDRCRGLQCCALSQKLCVIYFMWTPPLTKRQNYLESGLSPSCQVQCTLLLGDTHGYISPDLSHSQDVKYWRFCHAPQLLIQTLRSSYICFICPLVSVSPAWTLTCMLSQPNDPQRMPYTLASAQSSHPYKTKTRHWPFKVFVR